MRAKLLSLALSCAAALPLIATSTVAHAAGFYLQEQSVSQQGTAFAGTAANPTDASTIFYNPAGMTELGRATVTAGGSVIVPHLQFNDRGSTAGNTGGPFAAYTGNNGPNPFDPTPVPSMYGAMPLADGRYWIGLGISAPFGLSSDYGDDWFGRYDSISSDLMTINIAPVAAMKVTDRLSIGGGPNIQYANARLRNALPCPTAICAGAAFTPATDGLSELKGNSWGLGFNVGALWKATDNTQLGLHYRSQINQTLEGTATVSGLLGPLAAGNGSVGAEAELKQPDIVSFGIAHQMSPRLKLLGSANWFNWSNFDEIRVVPDTGSVSVVPENYDDSYAVAVGAEWKQTDHWTLRGGLQYDQTPTTLPDRSTRTPDSDRFWASVGARMGISDSLLIDIAASHIYMKQGRIGLTKDFYGTIPGVESTVNITGTTNSHIDIFSIQASWRF